MGIVPLSGRRAYIFLTAVARQGALAPPWPELRARYADLAPENQAMLDRLDPAGLIHHDLEELQEPAWGNERVWLLGDAAHGMTPNQGQGAGMAIEDAAALALVLDRQGGHGDYVAARHDRVRRVQLDSRRVGQVAAWRNALARGLRDLLVRAMPERTALAQYQGLVAPGLALAEALRR